MYWVCGARACSSGPCASVARRFWTTRTEFLSRTKIHLWRFLRPRVIQNSMSEFKVGEVVMTEIDGVEDEVIIVAIRQPGDHDNWSSAASSKRLFKVKQGAGRKYFVRQAHQLKPLP